jgi:hypothetical protein
MAVTLAGCCTLAPRVTLTPEAWLTPLPEIAAGIEEVGLVLRCEEPAPGGSC